MTPAQWTNVVIGVAARRVVVALVAGQPMWAIAGWVVGGVAAVAIVAVKARRGR
jgi:hypothetical protein